MKTYQQALLHLYQTPFEGDGQFLVCQRGVLRRRPFVTLDLKDQDRLRGCLPSGVAAVEQAYSDVADEIALYFGLVGLHNPASLFPSYANRHDGLEDLINKCVAAADAAKKVNPYSANKMPNIQLGEGVVVTPLDLFKMLKELAADGRDQLKTQKTKPRLSDYYTWMMCSRILDAWTAHTGLRRTINNLQRRSVVEFTEVVAEVCDVKVLACASGGRTDREGSPFTWRHKRRASELVGTLAGRFRHAHTRARPELAENDF